MRDGVAAAEAGAAAAGFVFWPQSRRCLDPDRALQLAGGLPPGLARVGVFVDVAFDEVVAIARHVGLTHLQLHGAEPPAYLQALPLPAIKGIRLQGPDDLAQLDAYRQAAAVLVEAHAPHTAGGAGLVLDPGLARAARERLQAAGFSGRFILAGGLAPENVAGAIHQVQPDGVDVSTGVETAGDKDIDKIYAFVAAAREAR